MIKVLLVEDEHSFINKVLEATSNSKYKVTAIRTGKEAVEYYDAHTPDLALIDIELADHPINGITVAEYIIAKHRIPFGFITRHVSEKSIYYANAKRVYPDVYFPKTAAVDNISILHILNDLESRLQTTYKRHPRESNNTILTSSGLFVPHKKDKDKLIFLAREDIVFIEASSGKCKIYPDTSVKNKPYTGNKNYSYWVDMSLQDLIDLLSTPLLIQLHRTYVVNIRHTTIETVTNAWRKRNYYVYVQSSNITTSFKVGSTFKEIAKKYAK